MVSVNFRVVGIYCYIPGLDFKDLSRSSNSPISPSSTIKEIQNGTRRGISVISTSYQYPKKSLFHKVMLASSKRNEMMSDGMRR